ncbi:hypothetical protein BH09PSE4_BH09PSE4_11730 [soil metagenome]
MEPLFYVMAIMGCSDGSAACSEQRVLPVRYASAQQCQMAMSAALMRNTDIDAPVITATCRSNGQNMADAAVRRSRNGG